MKKTMTTLQMVVAALVVTLAFMFAFVVTSPAFAEEWTVKVVGFDFRTAEVLLADEDGFIWTCPFGMSDWALGEEYVLVLEEGVNPEIKTIDEVEENV